MTVAEALAAARRALEAAGVREPALDAELLLRHVLGWDRARLVVDAHVPVPADAQARYDAAVARRAAREPLQHVTGVQAFWRHEFLVTPDVLVPRPETEHLVEAALGFLRGRTRPRLVDVGTGSGCIAISVAAERPDAFVAGVDLSLAALSVARRNAQRIGAAVALVRGDLLAAVRCADLVLSNPPYVEAAELPALDPEVRDHDPRLALVPPHGPAEIYARLARQAAACLTAGGALMAEVGAGQAPMVEDAFRAAGLEATRTVPDLAGIPRVVIAVRAGLGGPPPTP